MSRALSFPLDVGRWRAGPWYRWIDCWLGWLARRLPWQFRPPLYTVPHAPFQSFIISPCSILVWNSLPSGPELMPANGLLKAGWISSCPADLLCLTLPVSHPHHPLSIGVRWSSVLFGTKTPGLSISTLWKLSNNWPVSLLCCEAVQFRPRTWRPSTCLSSFLGYWATYINPRLDVL